MNRISELVCTHSAIPLVLAMAFGAFLIPGWLPPPDPALGADQIVDMFTDRRMRIQVSANLVAIGAMFYGTFTAMIAVQTARIEGASRPLTYVQLVMIPLTIIVIWLPAYLWLAMAYRLEASAATMQIFNDLAWLIFVGGLQPAIIQMLAVAGSILQDKREVPLYPKWVAYVTIWMTLSSFTVMIVPFFQTGPFTWKGLLCFWLAGGTFASWLLLMWVMTVKSINKHYASLAE